MGYVPPPPPPSKEEWDRRIAQGARTLEELDPGLDRWLRQQDLFAGFFITVITIGVAFMGLLLFQVALLPRL
jgi:hypothetical protein